MNWVVSGSISQPIAISGLPSGTQHQQHTALSGVVIFPSQTRKQIKSVDWHKMNDSEKLFHVNDCEIKYNETYDSNYIFANTSEVMAAVHYVRKYDKDFARKYLILL